MKALLTAAFTVLSVSSTLADSRPQLLKPDEAAVVGGWTAAWSTIDGVVLQPVVQDGACLRLSDSALLLSDHQTVDAAAMWSAHKIAPGRYAVVGVRWHAPYYDQYGVGGVSPQEGDFWTVTVAPNVVTDLGIWPISSPYLHRYVLGPPDPAIAQAAARSAAEGVAPLVKATWVRAPVVAPNAACPPAMAP